MDINKVIMESIRDIAEAAAPAPEVKIPKAGEKDPNYIPALRKAFNSLPKHGKNLRVYGKGQIPPSKKADQKLLDAAFKKEKAALDATTVGKAAVPPVAATTKTPADKNPSLVDKVVFLSAGV